MGPKLSTSKSSSVQETQIEQYQSVENQCVTNVVQTMSVAIKVEGSADKIYIRQSTGQIDSYCYFNNNLTMIANLYQEALRISNTSTDAGRGLAALGIQINVSEDSSIQEIEAALRQSFNNVCQTNVENRSDILVEVGGDLGEFLFEQTAEGVQTQCVAENLAKMEAQLTQYIEQQTSTGGQSRGIMMTIIIIVVVIVILVAVVGLVFSLLKGKKEKKTCTDIPKQCATLSGDAMKKCLLAQPIPKLPYCNLPTSPTVPKTSGATGASTSTGNSGSKTK
jgi:hypothetical protein